MTNTETNLERAEAAMLKLNQPVECPLTNLFCDGVYWREIFIPKDTLAIGHRHKTEHINVLLSGKVLVLKDGQPTELTAPQVFKSPAGTKKAVFAIEPTRWANVHANPTNEQEMEKLELIFIEKSAAFLEHEAEVKQLAQAALERSK